MGAGVGWPARWRPWRVEGGLCEVDGLPFSYGELDVGGTKHSSVIPCALM